ncbi:MAG: aminoacyl-tRNA hydrolase [Clostridia bacterium]|nr:aminoacyl-tRNA hydrolase [Clostridia bacterium]
MKPQGVGKALLKSVGYALLFHYSQVFAATLVEMVILMLLVSVKGMEVSAATELLPQIYYTVIYETMLLAALIFFGFLALMHRRNFTGRIGAHKAPAVSVFTGLFAGFACYLAAGALVSLAQLFPAVQASQEQYSTQHEVLEHYAPLWAELLYSCVMAPLVEEILCRGAILGTLKRSMRSRHAILLTGVIFAVIHGNLYQVVFTLPLGILLSYLAHRMGSIWPSVALHAAFNSTNYLVRLGTYLGYSQESPIWLFCYWAATLFCLFCIPVSLILYRLAKERVPVPEEKFVPSAPRFSFPGTFPPPNPNFQNDQAKGDSMAAYEYMIVGLGNPGEKYASNRHNMGFMALDYIALRQNTTIGSLRFRALTGETVIAGKKVLLLKPQTLMNSSGEAVREAAAFYKIPPERILVIFDDISFAPGVFRIRASGSAGGHNGIKSIISCLSSDAFPRIKMGVGTPPPGWELMNWVLGNPSKEDMEHVFASLEDVYASAKLFVDGRLDQAAASFNGKAH